MASGEVEALMSPSEPVSEETTEDLAEGSGGGGGRGVLQARVGRRRVSGPGCRAAGPRGL